MKNKWTTFDVNINSHIAIINLNRPNKRNSMIKEFWLELPQAIQMLDNSGNIRIVIIQSEGKHFTAGLDLSLFLANANRKDNTSNDKLLIRQTVHKMQHTFTCLENTRFPIIAAIQGGCIGAGVDLITACDLRYCSSDAYFVIQETNLGLTADVGTLQRIGKLLPEGICKELAYTGRHFLADEALKFGFVNNSFSDHKSLLNEVYNVAETIASKSPRAVWGSRKSIQYARDHSINDSLNFIADLQMGLLDSADISTSIESYQTGRKPLYKNLPSLEDNIIF